MDDLLIPRTQRQLDHLRMRTIGEMLAAALLLVGLLASSAQFPALGGIANLSALATIMLAVGAWHLRWEMALSAVKALEGPGCLRLRALAEADPAIASMVAAVRQMDRPMAFDDLWRANAWEVQREVRQKHAEEAAACRELNGIAS